MIFDGHIDTLAKIESAGELVSGTGHRDSPSHVDLPRAIEAGVDGMVMAICAEAEKDPAAAWTKMKSNWDGLARGDYDRSDWPDLYLMIEGCQPVVDLPDLDDILDEVRVATLTWNGENSLGGGIGSESGLSSEGRAFARRLHEKGVMLDVSHLSDASRRDLLDLGLPVVATHCNCRQVLDHPRNLPTEDIREIASRGGIIGITFPSYFLARDASLEDVLRHLEHALDAAGEDCVGFGSDFDGTRSLPEGITDVASWPAVLEFLGDRSWPGDLVRKIAGGNWKRVFSSMEQG